MSSPKRAIKLIPRKYLTLEDAARIIHEKPPQERKHVDFALTMLSQTMLPSRSVPGSEWTSADRSLTLLTPSAWGIPFGPYARAFLFFLASEAVRTKESSIYLGGNLSEAMRRVVGPHASNTGGPRGTQTMLRRAINSILRTSINFETNSTQELDLHFEGEAKRVKVNKNAGVNFPICEEYEQAIEPFPFGIVGEDTTRYYNTIKLSEWFFRECIKHSAPVDRLALQALFPNCALMDIYVWSTYRANFLLKSEKRELRMGWDALQQQFGSNFKEPRKFRDYFTANFNLVASLYPDTGGILKMDLIGDRICFRPLRTSVLEMIPPPTPLSRSTPPTEDWESLRPSQKRRILAKARDQNGLFDRL